MPDIVNPAEDKELATQLRTYSDSITAFAILQGLAFVFLIVQNVAFACAVRARWYLAAPLIVVATYFYYRLVRGCHAAEDRLVGIPSDRSNKIGFELPKVRKWKSRFIFAIGVLEFLMVIGLKLFPPIFDCQHP